MELDQFEIGAAFLCGGRQWHCTDIGTRVVTATLVDPKAEMEFMSKTFDAAPQPYTLTGAQAEAEGWFRGPPYAVVEHVFDENDLPACAPCSVLT